MKSGSATVYFDDSRELRIGTLIRVAERLPSSGLSSIVSAAFGVLVTEWKTESLDINDGVALLATVSGRDLILHPSRRGMREKIVHALILEASKGCRSDQFRELLNEIKPDEIDFDLEILLKRAAENYRMHRFPSELDECNSQSDFEALEEDILTVSERTGLNLEGPVDAVRTAKAEYVEQQAQYEDLMHEEWKERRVSEDAGDVALDDLFDSLRQ
jgi:hypothetical protein